MTPFNREAYRTMWKSCRGSGQTRQGDYRVPGAGYQSATLPKEKYPLEPCSQGEGRYSGAMAAGNLRFASKAPTEFRSQSGEIIPLRLSLEPCLQGEGGCPGAMAAGSSSLCEQSSNSCLGFQASGVWRSSRNAITSSRLPSKTMSPSRWESM